MDVQYGFMWNEFRHEIVDPMSEKAAQKRWSGGQSNRSFEVVLGNPSAPAVTIVGIPKGKDPGAYIVYFYDEVGRRQLSYAFGLRDDGRRLFLDTVTGWTWDSPDKRETTDACSIETYQFREDGYSSHSVRDVSQGHSDVTESVDVPLDMNWEPMPSFGDWASLSRQHRLLPAGDPSNSIS